MQKYDSIKFQTLSYDNSYEINVLKKQNNVFSSPICQPDVFRVNSFVRALNI